MERNIEEILSPKSDSFSHNIISESHKRNCDSACYDCLRVYRNMTYHGLLDWRLGLAYLRVLKDSEYTCGLDGKFAFPEIEGWLDLALGERDKFAEQFNYKPNCWGMLPGFEADEKRIIMVHPLWDTTNPEGILARAVAESGGMQCTDYIDTFNLLRRPGWCHMQLEH
jgi:DEAD/DEAH box helicase domain-containing protein